MAMRKKLLAFTERLLALFLDNLYVKPKNVCRLLLHPGRFLGRSYFPEQKSKSKTAVLADQLRNILLYGDVDHFYYFYGLDVKRSGRRGDYVHYAVFSKRRDRLNLSSPFNSSCILRNKLYFGIFARAVGLTTPANVAYVRMPDVLLLETGEHVSLEKFVDTCEGNLFCKLLDGECGTGIFELEIRGRRIFIDGAEADAGILHARLCGGAFLMQERVKQHHSLDELYAGAVNTVRLVTVRDLRSGGIEVLPSILRVGANGSRVDNTSQGGIAVGFDLQTGRLNELGFFKPEFGLTTTVHPDSGIRFGTFVLPHLDTMIEQAKYFHSFLGMHSIGWDIALGEMGPIFIEGNDNWEINGHQDYEHGLMADFRRLFYE